MTGFDQNSTDQPVQFQNDRANPVVRILTLPETFPVTAGDVNIYHARLIADQQITCVLEFADQLDIHRLTRALTILHETLPILSTVISFKGTRFQRVRQLSYQPVMDWVSEPVDRAQEIVRFIGTPCQPQVEPPVKLLLVRKHGDDTLCFKIDHILSDAGGLRHLVSLFAEAYTYGSIGRAINPNRGFGQVFRHFSPLTLLRAFQKSGLPVPGPRLLHGSFDGEGTFIEHVCLEPHQFEQMHLEAKRRHATVNDMLLAALYQVIFQYLPEDTSMPYPVMVPVDMRRYLPEEKRRIIGNLSSAVYPSLAVIPNEAFDDTLKRVQACMQAFKQEQPGLGAMLLMALGSVWGGQMLRRRYQQAAARGSRFINYTNFRLMEAEDVAFDTVAVKQVFGIGPIQYAPGFLIALSTYRNTLHFVVQGKGSREFQTAVRKFLEAILSCLQERFG